MYRLVIVPGVLSDAAEISGGAAASSGTGVEQLLSPGARDVWVTESLPSVSVDLHLDATDLPVDLAYDSVACLYGNWSDGDTFEVHTAATQGGLDTPAWSSGPVSPIAGRRGRHWRHGVVMFEEQTEPWMRLSFEVSSPVLPTGYGGAPFFELARVLVGGRYEPPVGYRLDYRLLQEAGKLVSQPNALGEVTQEARGRRRGIELTIAYMARQHVLGELDDLLYAVGSDQQSLVMVDADAVGTDLDRLTYYGYLSESPISSRAADSHNRVVQVWQEVA